MNTLASAADFSHIWDFINEAGSVDVDAVADDLQPQSSSNCSSASGSSQSQGHPNNAAAATTGYNSSYYFINQPSQQQQQQALTKSTLINDEDDFNDILFSNSGHRFINTTNSLPNRVENHDSLSFINYSIAGEPKEAEKHEYFLQGSATQSEHIDDFLIDFRHTSSEQHESQYGSLVNSGAQLQLFNTNKRPAANGVLINSPQSHILTPPSSASSATSQQLDMAANLNDNPIANSNPGLNSAF